MNQVDTLVWIPLLPLIGFLINGLFGSRMPKNVVAFVACGSVGMSFAISLAVFFAIADGAATQTVYHWISVGSLTFDFGFFVDNLTAVMLLVITGVGLLIHIYSVGYMAHDPGFARYFSYLNLFVFAMLLLVMGDNLVLLFVGWEGVGLCSYLLIGFWYTDQEKAKAGQKAFITNRIGDLGVLVGLFLLVGIVGSLSIVDINTAASHTHEAIAHVQHDAAAHTPEGESANVNVSEKLGEHSPQMQWLYDYSWVIALFLFLGACGKSAQIPLYVWLPDAMAGPTPVSSLIHAATMVTAGVFLIVRLGALFALSPFASAIITVVGACTALLAALIALSQTDIKKVLAYSTVSQLGFMFMAAGAGAVHHVAYVAAIFHLVTHAFFKALLFMGSGSVIHSMHHAYPDKDETFHQDFRNMGGLSTKMRITYLTFVVGSLALAGFPFLAGFYSKDEILHGVLGGYFDGTGITWILYGIAFVIGIIAAFLTAFYTTRLVVRTFHGEHKGTAEGYAHLHESPSLMWVPLVILAVLSIIGGAVNTPGANVPGQESPSIPNLEHALLHPDKPEQSLLGTTLQHAGHHEEATHASVEEGGWVENTEDEFLVNIFGGLKTDSLVLMGVSGLIALAGIFIGYRLYTTGWEKHQASFTEGSFRERARQLSYDKFRVDEMYQKWILGPLWAIAAILYILVDRLLIDTSIFLAGQLVLWVSGLARRVQTGLLSVYAQSFTVGAVLVLLIVFILLWST